MQSTASYGDVVVLAANYYNCLTHRVISHQMGVGIQYEMGIGMCINVLHTFQFFILNLIAPCIFSSKFNANLFSLFLVGGMCAPFL